MPLRITGKRYKEVRATVIPDEGESILCLAKHIPWTAYVTCGEDDMPDPVCIDVVGPSDFIVEHAVF